MRVYVRARGRLLACVENAECSMQQLSNSAFNVPATTPHPSPPPHTCHSHPPHPHNTNTTKHTHTTKQADREALSAQLSEMEDWLYGDGEDEKKSVYIAKLQELKARGDPIEQRAADDGTRGKAVQQLEAIANQYVALADSSLPAHAHLAAADRETLKKEAGSALAWLQEKVALQSQVYGVWEGCYW